jgi:hypothetical protein
MSAVEKFKGWLSSSRKRDTIVYFRGVTACKEDGFRYAAPHLAWKAYEEGLVKLVQRRMGRNDFEYIAQRV